MRTAIVLDAKQSRAYAVATNWDAIAPGETPIGLHTFFANLTAPHHAHGGPCKYVSANSDLLGWVIERAAGKTFASLVSDLLWKPMGAEHPAYIAVDCEGHRVLPGPSVRQPTISHGWGNLLSIMAGAVQTTSFLRR